MSPVAAFHAQLASIMEVLANTAVAEICELVDSGYSALQLEISRSRKENEALRRRLRLMELRAARAGALRAAAAAACASSGAALLSASGRVRAQAAPHHPVTEPKRSRTPEGEEVTCRVSPRETPSGSGQEAARLLLPVAESSSPTTAAIKVEDDDGPWSRSEQDSFCAVGDGQVTAAGAPHLPAKREAAGEDDSLSQSWMSGEVSSTSTSLQKSLSTSQRPDTGGYDRLVYEPQLRATQNPLGEDPGCSYVLNNSVSVSADSGSGFTFTVTECSLSAAEHQRPAAFRDGQKRAPPAAGEPRRPAGSEATEGRSAFVRRDAWRHPRGAAPHGREDGEGKSFVCNCCGKTLACLKNLKTHMRVHTGEKPFVCALCGKRFSDSSNLKRHQSVHTGEKRYGCVHCGKRFAQSGSLKVHMTVHTDCKQFRCSYCDKTFISGSHLRRHVTMHAGQKRFASAL